MKLLLSYLIFIIYAPCLFADLKVIANKNTTLSKLTKTELKKLYTGRLNKIDGQKITVIILKDGSAKEQLLRSIVKMSKEQFKRHWMRMIFTGKSKALTEVDSEEEMLHVITNNPNSIGIMNGNIFEDKAKLIAIE
jgi:ABC-type phosphate transport system substrate-binding protein